MDNLRLPFVAADEAPGLGADFFLSFFFEKRESVLWRHSFRLHDIEEDRPPLSLLSVTVVCFVSFNSRVKKAIRSIRNRVAVMFLMERERVPPDLPPTSRPLYLIPPAQLEANCHHELERRVASLFLSMIFFFFLSISVSLPRNYPSDGLDDDPH
jgi:hypothetical protein